jgi:TonB family protein
LAVRFLSGLLVFLLAFFFSFYLPGVLSAQTQPDAAPKRHVISHSAPAYPILARNMALEGVVRLEVLVAADGAVKAVDIKGGHPVLAQAAATTVRQWRWEKAAYETREPVEIKFSRQ